MGLQRPTRASQLITGLWTVIEKRKFLLQEVVLSCPEYLYSNSPNLDA